ncbi:RDD family protein [Sinobaca sp. H24]|nr:RDD family protein [Sinobaca sp. H24]
MTKLTGQTLGKMIFGLKVIRKTGCRFAGVICFSGKWSVV